jgi:uncharacterized repeat protein (TIGR03803 family)
MTLRLVVPDLNAQDAFTNLFSFGGTNGIEPEGGLFQASDGNFYGTARDTTATSGGNFGFGAHGRGTVFRITTKGAFTTLVSFIETNANGAFPRTGLIQGPDGNFYGTTVGGGATRQGTIFKLTSDGVLTILASFGGTNGAVPVSTLVQRDNKFYGVTMLGGLKKNARDFVGDFPDNGTVFSITTNGLLKTAALFNGTNGANPSGALIEDKLGNLYGTTVFSLDTSMLDTGAKAVWGTVFKLSREGTLSTLAVCDGINGDGPRALAQTGDGSLYGITQDGRGTNVDNPTGADIKPFSGSGTVFHVNPSGKITTLLVFNGINGSNPESLILGRDGNFYGTTSGGGVHNLGTIFQMAPSGKLTTLYSFTESGGSWRSRSTLMQGTDGHLYGTTSRCGKFQCGSIFRLTLH